MKRISVLLAVFLFINLMVTQVTAKTGSYTMVWNGVAPDGTVLNIKAVAEDGTTYDESLNVGGMTQEQAQALLLTDMQSAGWAVTANGTNGIIVTGHGTTNTSPISRIWASDDHEQSTVKPDGTVWIIEAPPSIPQEFEFSFGPPATALGFPGTLVANIGPLVLNIQLDPGDPPFMVAQKLEAAMTGAGLIVSRVDSTVVLNWSDPVNAALLPSPLHVDMGVYDAAAGPMLMIGLPDSQPTAIPTLTQWGLIILAFLFLTAGTWFIIRKRTARAVVVG